MNSISDIRTRLESIPIVLRIAAIASIGIGIAFPLVALIPGSNFDLAGTKMTWQELWQTRVALAVLVTGPLMLLVGFAIIRRARWVRSVLVVLPVLQFLPFQVVHWVFSAPNPTPSLVIYLLSIAVWALLAAIYLFLFEAAVDYFSHEGVTA